MTSEAVEHVSSQPVVKVGPCEYVDPMHGRCGRTGPQLRLTDGLGGLYLRHLCSDHSDWLQVKR